MNSVSISWADYTHQFWIGNIEVSEECKYRYMHRIVEKHGQDSAIIEKVNNEIFHEPKKFKKGTVIFVNSISDFFHPVADEWRQEAWDVIKACPQHTWLILTKRPERIIECLPHDWVGNYANVMLGVTIERQKYVERLYHLSEVPDTKRFISAEPLLGPLKLTFEDEYGIKLIDAFKWCIIGGESGEESGPYEYRECKLEWIENLVTDLQTNAPHINIHVAQLGSCLKKQMNLKGFDGSDPSEFPEKLRLRSKPKVPNLTNMSGKQKL